MVNLTRSNIAYDLKISPHRATVDGITYIFSSELYRNKFFEKLQENREKINTSLSNRFNLHICFNRLADIKLYTTIEKRGFLVQIDEVMYTCENSIRLGGETATPRT